MVNPWYPFSPGIIGLYSGAARRQNLNLGSSTGSGGFYSLGNSSIGTNTLYNLGRGSYGGSSGGGGGAFMAGGRSPGISLNSLGGINRPFGPQNMIGARQPQPYAMGALGGLGANALAQRRLLTAGPGMGGGGGLGNWQGGGAAGLLAARQPRPYGVGLGISGAGLGRGLGGGAAGLVGARQPQPYGMAGAGGGLGGGLGGGAAGLMGARQARPYAYVGLYQGLGNWIG